MRCEVRIKLPSMEKIECFSEAVVRITVGCVHEHITSSKVCRLHKDFVLDNINSSKDKHKMCQKCCDEFAMDSGLMSGTNHICPVSLCKVEELN